MRRELRIANTFVSLYHIAFLDPTGDIKIKDKSFRLGQKPGQKKVPTIRNAGEYVLQETSKGVFSIHVEAPLPGIISVTQEKILEGISSGKALFEYLVGEFRRKIYKLTSGSK